ncbi:VirB2 family type IV secretion system major pilin TrwL [Bartonella krasnovii]|uniref:VirB2 family type IV secretion system major pilin TrwL n=1 Tax=Bartonella krasnovii TaxID=2267275 RepID=UPI001F4C8D74|nr:VirB2 family type IV secretion system major pilin TrwL [Bartonella krasnovii]UNF51922.1 VirB2 family type IV secretion system major pilin TrwL [Bartonella krasnovii]
MKKLISLKLKNNNSVIVIFAAISAFFITHSAYANPNLGHAKKALEGLKSDLTTHIIPIAAALILLCLAVLYAGRYIGKDTFVRWAIGVVIAGSATELANLLFAGKA